MAPRLPRKLVGRAGVIRGPSEAMSTSAAGASASAAQKALRPGEPISSPVSTGTSRLKPSAPRVASTAARAVRFTRCWPSLSVVPRP
jgi:hypothetical protein